MTSPHEQSTSHEQKKPDWEPPFTWEQLLAGVLARLVAPAGDAHFESAPGLPPNSGPARCYRFFEWPNGRRVVVTGAISTGDQNSGTFGNASWNIDSSPVRGGYFTIAAGDVGNDYELAYATGPTEDSWPVDDPQQARDLLYSILASKPLGEAQHGGPIN